MSVYGLRWGAGELHDSEAACVAHGAGELSVANPLHAALDNGDYPKDQRNVYATMIESQESALLIPSFLVRAVLKGILEASWRSSGRGREEFLNLGLRGL